MAKERRKKTGWKYWYEVDNNDFYMGAEYKFKSFPLQLEHVYTGNRSILITKE